LEKDEEGGRKETKRREEGEGGRGRGEGAKGRRGDHRFDC